jgi:iron complex outermembrane receptor protein
MGSPAFVNVEYRFLKEDSDPRLEGYENAHQNAVGISIDLGNDWRLDAYANRSENKGFQRRGAITNGAALTAALASSDPATAFNPFGDGSANVANIPSLVDIIIANRDTYATSTARDFSIKADGPLFSLPAGDVRVAIGAERHDNEFRQRLDANNVLPSGDIVTKNIRNQRHNTSLFAELYVPIVGPDNAVSGIQSLNLSLAARREDYSDFGTTTDPKVGVTWKPVEDLTVRATYGTSFRAPSLVDTSEQIHNIFIQNLPDPTSPTGVTRGIFHNGGRSLLAEEATTWSAGLDWRPLGALHGLYASVTYYDVEYSDRIDVVPNSALTNPDVYAPFIVRRPDPADTAGNAAFDALIQAFLNDPNLQNPVEPVSNLHAIVDGRRANLAALEQTGLDISVGYAFETGIGAWRVGLDAAKILKLERSTAPGIPLIDVLDTFGNPVDLRARLALSWQSGGWAVHGYLNHIDGYRNTAITPNVAVDDYRTVDATILYNFADEGALGGASLALSGQNILDETPPIVLNGISSWDNHNVSPLGRFISLTLTKRW